MDFSILTRAEFYDLFGLPIFVFIVIISMLQLLSKKPLPKKIYWILLIIGIAGIITDSAMVFFKLLLGR